MMPQSKDRIDTSKNTYFGTLPFFKEEKTQKFVGIALTILALSFFGLFAINPALTTIAKLRKEVTDSEFVDSQLGKKIEDINRLKLQYVSLQNDLPIIFESLPKNAGVPLLTAEIQSVAQDFNVHIKKIQNFEVELFRNNKKVNKKYYSYNFSITGNGAYEDISQFISNLTNMRRIINIDVLSLVRSTTNDDLSTAFTINAIAYIKE